MKIRSLLLSLSVFCAIVVCFAPGLHSQDAKPAPAAPEPTDTVSADAGAPTSTSSSESDSKLRVLSGSTEEEKQKEPAPTSSKSSTRKKARIHGIHHSGQPYIATEFSIRKGETAGDVVAIRSKGVIDGDVDGDVVCILSRVTINGHVNGDVVDILGSVRLGPDAVIDGEKVAIIGAVTSVDQVGNAKGGFGGVEQLQMWLEHALMHGRILALHSSLRWVWVMMMGSIAFYAFLALILRKPMDTCAAAFETSPGYSILCGVLILLMFPLVLALSAITVVGPIVLIFALPLVSLFGRATMMAFLGSRLTRLTAENNPLRHPFFGVLIGSAIALLLYLLPVVGVIVWALIGVLGLGSVVYAIIVAIRRKPKAPPAPVVPPAPPVPSAASSAVPPILPVMPEVIPTDPSPSGATLAPPALASTVPPVAASTLPRAGFQVRLIAALLDIIMVAVAWHILGLSRLNDNYFHIPFPLVITAYTVVMWALKGTTVGGIICSLKVVRVDDGPVTWTVALVRALAAFLSLAVAGVGFIWVMVDEDKQSWHDKIAGTVIVKVPKGHSLI